MLSLILFSFCLGSFLENISANRNSFLNIKLKNKERSEKFGNVNDSVCVFEIFALGEQLIIFVRRSTDYLSE